MPKRLPRLTIRGTPRTTRRYGGPRANSGRFTYFPGKNTIPVSVILTDDARGILARATERLEASASDVIEGLIRSGAGSLALPLSASDAAPPSPAARAAAPRPQPRRSR